MTSIIHKIRNLLDLGELPKAKHSQIRVRRRWGEGVTWRHGPQSKPHVYETKLIIKQVTPGENKGSLGEVILAICVGGQFG